MKPYIEKNDGVPDNNRYSEALEAAKETVEALNKLTDQALAQYTALVDSAVAGHITDERELEHIMDGLLDFGDDLRFLEIYKRLCRHILYKHPQMVGEHIYLWRMQFDSFNHEHTCLASKLTNIELSDICPLAKAGQPFEVARENTCEECKYFCRIHYEVDPEYGDKQVHFWMNEEIVTFF